MSTRPLLPRQAAAPSVRTVTLGCKVNQYETEWVREGLISAGYRDAPSREVADLCIVNTCTVTATGDAKSRQVIRRLARENPGSRIVVMGCYATRAPEEVRQLPQVVEVVTDKRELPDLLGRFGVVEVPDGISQFGDRHRAFLKVQDGCLLRCSYCIIPQVRPHMSSRAPEAIVAEARRLVEHGYRELVLTGIHLGHYGVDQNRGKPRDQWCRLSSLLRDLLQLEGDFRLRLSSIEATEVTRELLSVMRDFPHRVCPHLHICVQSGSDAVLRRMRRRWGAQRILDRCLLAREYVADLALTTDVIVGFPGESDADFAATCELTRQAAFCKVHIFPFSPRRGTPAAHYDDPIPPAVKQQRVAALAELERNLRADYQRQLVGREIEVLVEGHIDGKWMGTSCRYLPTELIRLPRDAQPLGRVFSAQVLPPALPAPPALPGSPDRPMQAAHVVTTGI